MEFYDAIKNRRTIRELKNTTVADDVMGRIISAGMQVPTHNHQREWEFIILRDEQEKDNALQFAKAYAEGYLNGKPAPETASPQQKMYAYTMPKQYTMLAKSGCVILPFCKGSGSMNLAVMWCCIENIFLAAAAEGLACSMRIPVGNEGANVARAVGAPARYTMSCYIGIGYPEENAAVLEQVERNAREAMHFGKW